MRFQINWICLALLLSTPVFAVEQVRPKLQGLWSRVGHQSRYKISGNSFEEYKANNPTSPSLSSSLASLVDPLLHHPVKNLKKFSVLTRIDKIG